MTEDKVQEFKKLWYLSVVTGQTQKLHLDKGKVEDITPNTQPESVGIKDIETIRDISIFKGIIGRVQLLGYALEKQWRYLDEDAFNAYWELKGMGLIKDMQTPFNPVADLRVSDKSYVIWTFLDVDKELISGYITTQYKTIEDVIGKLD